jgi:hypothetical protein
LVGVLSPSRALDSDDAMSVLDVAATGFVALLDVEAIEHNI